MLPAAAVMMAAVAFFVAALSVVMVMVVASCIRIVFKRACGKSLCSLVGAALHSSVNPDSGLGQRNLRTHSYSAADEGIDPGFLKKACQSAVSVSVSIENLLSDDLSVLRFVQLELLRMSEMLENLTVEVCCRDNHVFTPLF